MFSGFIASVKLPKLTDAKKKKSYENEIATLSGWGKTADGA